MDLKVIETGNGGDLARKLNDLFVINGLQNMPYLAMFGGNPVSTPTKRLPNEQAFDFWGNSLFHPNDQGLQFNSTTEKKLLDVALTSSGRVQIENAVKEDLKFMKQFAQVNVSVSITDVDRVEISIKLTKPDNLQEKEFIYIWDSTKKELEFVLPESSSGVSGGGGYFDDSFDFSFE
jgi:hypothetical protein